MNDDKLPIRAKLAPKDAREALRGGRDLNATAANAENFEEFHPPTPPALPPPDPPRSLLHYYKTPPDPATTILGERFLCRMGAMLFVGPSGIGKSSASAQQDICWALGREAFGIQPARPLKILVLQAENDDGDLHEMARGVLDGVLDMATLSQDEVDMLERNCLYVTVNDRSAEAFLTMLAGLLDEHKPDVVRLDPLFAYAGCDPVDTGKLSVFLRAGLNPLLTKHRCGAIINHHTPKITNRDTSKWSALDFSYAAAGGAELTNWARAVIVINPTSDPFVFEFIAAKRGRRIGWRDPFGHRALRRMFAHTKEDGQLFWEEADEAAVQSATKKKARYDIEKMILDAVPLAGSIEKDALVYAVNGKGPGIGSVKATLKMMLDSDKPVIFEWREKRTRTNPRRRIGRSPQPDGHGADGQVSAT